MSATLNIDRMFVKALAGTPKIAPRCHFVLQTGGRLMQKQFRKFADVVAARKVAGYLAIKRAVSRSGRMNALRITLPVVSATELSMLARHVARA
eukprot:6214565-Pleurochrysis_carterae.AAC.1